MANMKTHLRKGRYPNIKDKQQEEIWENIKTRNEGIEMTRTGKKKGGGRNETFIPREIHYGRIRNDWGGRWMCERCPYERNDERSLRNHLAMTRKETQIKNIQCPKCEKTFKRIGNLKQHQLQIHKE